MDIVLSLLALVSLCLFFTSVKGGNASLAPLFSVTAAMVWFSLAGMLGLLVVGGWVFYIAALGAGVWALVRQGRALLQKLLAPGLLLFLALAVVFALWFAVRQPVFSIWDEFNSWGLMAKLVKLKNQLYPVLAGETGFWYTMTERPGLVVISYFVQFFSSGFAPWKVYWGYSLLLAACLAAPLAAVALRRWRVALPLAAACLLTPFFFDNANATVELAKTFLSAYGDLPAGMLFGGVLVAYFVLRGANQAPLWALGLPLAALALVKENVYPLALVAAGVMAADCLFFGIGRGGFAPVAAPAPAGRAKVAQPQVPGSPRLMEAMRRLGASVGFFAAVLLPSVLWGRYAAWAHVTYNTFMQDANTNMSAFEAVRQALAEIFGLAPRSQAFYRVAGEMWDSFLGRVKLTDGSYQNGILKVSMAGTGLVTLLLILLVFALAITLAGTAHRRKRMALAGGLMLGGFAAYHLMLFVYYAYLDHNRGQTGIDDYSRYIVTYYAGWFLLGLLFLVLAAKWAGRHQGRLARVALLALAVFMAVRFATMVRPGYSVLDFPANAYDDERAFAAESGELAAQMEPGSRVFYVNQTGDGGEYFQRNYHLQPIVLEYSLTGGGPILPLEPGAEDSTWYISPLSPQRLEQYLLDYDCRYILVDALDEAFIENFGGVFAEGLTLADSLPALYERGADGLYRLVWQAAG